MKIAIVGAGAIGAYIGTCLAISGDEVAMVARGAHLEAMRQRGVRIRFQNGEQRTARPFVTDDPAAIGLVDVVFLTLKTHSLAAMAPRLAPLLGPETPIIAGQNGIPWWYFENYSGPLAGTHLESVDPAGYLSSMIPARSVIGCVIYCSAAMAEPGVIEHIEGNRIAIGELDGARSDRCHRITQAFQKAGLRCAVRSRIRHEVWVKLIGNLALNPISALTRADMAEIVRHPDTFALTRAIMAEGEAVARALGMEIDITIDQRLEGAARVGKHKTSTLQDIEAGRPLELEAIVGAVVELAAKLGIPVPHTQTVYACARLLESKL